MNVSASMSTICLFSSTPPVALLLVAGLRAATIIFRPNILGMVVADFVVVDVDGVIVVVGGRIMGTVTWRVVRIGVDVEWNGDDARRRST